MFGKKKHKSILWKDACFYWCTEHGNFVSNSKGTIDICPVCGQKGIIVPPPKSLPKVEKQAKKSFNTVFNKYYSNVHEVPSTNAPVPPPPPRQSEGIETSRLHSTSGLIQMGNMKVITKDEFILNHMLRFKCTKEQAIESFNKCSEGYNFLFAVDKNNFYSAKYINEILKR